MAIYLKVDGLEGSVTAEGHEGWTECHSLQLNVSRVITTSTGSSQERESSAPSVSEVTVTKVMDKSTPALFTEACVGRSKLVKIDLVQTGEQLVTYMSYELENSLISGYAVSTDGDRPTESVSFNFTKIVMTYTPYDKEHNPGSPIPAGYDIRLGKKT